MIVQYLNRIAFFTRRFLTCMRPVILSALSILITFLLLQPVALRLDASFSLLSSRSVGKIALTVIVLLHIALLVAFVSRTLLYKILDATVLFFQSKKWIKPFFIYFFSFFIIHSLLLCALLATPYVVSNPAALSLLPAKLGSLLWGFVATFFLAWTEETIFRGALFQILLDTLSPLASIIATSAIFMLAHNLTNPLAMVTTNLSLGVGLFLLGMFLNTVFFITKKLYIGMGIHAGLVFVKVVLRRVPLVTFSPILPWWLHPDLRMSYITHTLFAIVIVGLIIYNRRLFVLNKPS